jgi:glycosyltransferase involved in cell wall biosynthesis
MLVDPHAPAQLHAAIDALARNAGLRAQMGERGRRRVEERFDLCRNMARYAALFRRV